MKKFISTFLAFGCGICLQAQADSSTPKLAIVPESEGIGAVVDLLTVEFSKNDQVQLLERAEIDKVIREEALSKSSMDSFKLGQLLGADGLLMLQTHTEGTNQFLSVQLIAVKPGVVLTADQFLWPAADPAAWVRGESGRIGFLLPKLEVPAKDAVPISISDFHSGVRTAAASDLERQLFFLTVERLVQEKRVFVLERKRMRGLSEEKELAGKEAEPFWNGKYVLEGTIDRDGVDLNVVTVSARLIPASGSPILLEASGRRTNCLEAADQLVGKILAALNLGGAPTAWSPATESEKFFKEAQWDFSWGLLPEVQAAVESAWALGKHDSECAVLRIKTYLPEVAPRPEQIYETGSMTGGGNMDLLALAKLDLSASQPIAAIFKRHSRVVYHAATHTQPESKAIDRANHLLELYYEYSQTIPANERKIDSQWYSTGLDCVVAGSEVLAHFHFVPASQKDNADKLSELRSRIRKIVSDIEQSPMIHDSYFGAQELTGRNPDHSGEPFLTCNDIFACKLAWGSLWQENPQDCLSLYETLMQSPNYLAIHEKLWFRPLTTPRLCAWAGETQSQINADWNKFVGQLIGSTNVMLQLEGNSLTMADAETDGAATNAFSAILKVFSAHADLFVSDSLAQRCLDWPLADLVSSLDYENPIPFDGSRVITPTGDYMREQIKVDFIPKATQLKSEYEAKHAQQIAVAKNQKEYEGQISFLKGKAPYDPNEFVHRFLFGYKDYTHEQAAEIKPLLADYRKQVSGRWAGIAAMQVGQVEANVDRILKPDTAVPAPPHSAMAADVDTRPANAIRPALLPSHNPNGGAISVPQGMPPQFVQQAPFVHGQPPMSGMEMPSTEAPAPPPLVSSNIIAVKDFYALPTDGLPGDQPHDFVILDHQYVEGRLLLSFRYNAWVYSSDSGGDKVFVGMAIFDPSSKHWELVMLPESFREPVPFSSQQAVLWQGGLYSSHTGKIRKYDFTKQSWGPSGFAVDSGGQLYNLDGRLFITDWNSIQEIIENGQSSKLFASIQRQPPVSLLDSQGALMNLAVFLDAQKNLCAAVHNKYFRWDGNDWQEIGAARTSFSPSVFQDGILLMTDGFNQSPAQISTLPKTSAVVELCLSQPERRGSMRRSNSSGNPKPLWKLPAELSLPNFSAALWRSDLFLMADHSEKQDIVEEQRGTGPDGKQIIDHVITGQKYQSKEGYNSALYCFSRGEAAAEKILLNFDNPAGCPPMTGSPAAGFPPMFSRSGHDQGWMLFSTNYLFCGRGNPPGNFKPGIWVLPSAPILAEISALKTAAEKTKVKEVLPAP